MKNKRAICVVLCAALGLAACSSSSKDWIYANPPVSTQFQGGH